MTDMLERTHHEPLVVRRLASKTDRPAAKPPRRNWRRVVAGAVVAVAAILFASAAA